MSESAGVTIRKALPRRNVAGLYPPGVGERALAAHAALAELEAERGRLREASERIIEWADAYPLSVFPEPDFKKAAAVLKAAGMTLDAISASNFRHCLKGVKRIASAALAGEAGEGEK